MNGSGFIRGLRHVPEKPVQYFLQLDETLVPLTESIGGTIRIGFEGQLACTHCGRKVKKLFQSGYCYPCFTTLAECDLCILKPHECHYDKGTCRDESFAHEHCMVPHYVYIALSNHVKVGLTRKSRGTARWIDQGAARAIPIAELPTRKMAGELEFALMDFLPDKTDWRKMLKGDIEDVDLLSVVESVRKRVPEPFRPYLLDDEQVYEFVYPQLDEIAKIKSISLDKARLVEGKLIGIKGQYLLLDVGVLNIRKHTGYAITVSIEDASVEAIVG